MSKKNKLHKIENPHDKFFKAIIQDPKNATDLLIATCPTEVTTVIDFDSLKLVKDSYLTGKLKEWFSDIVYQCKTKEGDLKLTLLFEHKSYKTDPYPQLLRYIAEVIDTQQRKREPRTPVLTIIFYHHKDKWTAKPFIDTFENCPEALKKYIPNFEYLLIDTNNYTDEEIRWKLFKNDTLVLMCGLMKHYFDNNSFVEYANKLLVERESYLTTAHNVRLLHQIMLYLLEQRSFEEDDIEKIASNMSATAKGKIMTAYEKMAKREQKIGMEAGKEKMAIEMARTLLKQDVALEIVAKASGISIEDLKKL